LLPLESNIFSILSTDHNDLIKCGEIIDPKHPLNRGSVTFRLNEAIELEVESSLPTLDLNRGVHIISIAKDFRVSTFFQ
jgi:hypothetical protein